MLHQQIDLELAEREAWALRRQRGIPNDRRLFVLACMDERIPVNQALGIRDGDAHVFRNAGGLVTDDAIRSAMLTTQFFGTKEIASIFHRHPQGEWSSTINLLFPLRSLRLRAFAVRFSG